MNERRRPRLPSVSGERGRGGAAFIDEDRLHALLRERPEAAQVRAALAKASAKEPLTVEETAALLTADDSLVEEQLAAARALKNAVYGNRIVLFAPLYVGNACVNDCTYCGFRRSNRDAVRRTLSGAELDQQTRALVRQGHKRLILVFGEHPDYDADFIADSVRQVYAVREGKGAIRRVNINAAPLDRDGYTRVRDAGIGTYQVFQETYHRATYAQVHPPKTRKGDFDWRLTSLGRAMEAGLDDVGIGALFGLYDWRFETLALVAHANHLREVYGCGPHTVSFPRLRPASGVADAHPFLPSDDELERIVATLRLAIPYTGLILTAREPAALRRRVMAYGVSQIDAGSRLELGGYTEAGDAQVQVREREQFELGDVRSLDTVMRELVADGYLPSFCTACYRLGRTGEHFMEFAIPGFIKRLCTPNALCTLEEYLVDYASPETRAAGEALIARELTALEGDKLAGKVKDRLARIATSDERDLVF
ncbi:MAG: [FeFe] hydrogenase H-cluster radical SAM maturase HydG [Deltaproteobacteria bacterium HGW-Deltaproteobacteria-14]|jgi:2-iminoacetate synthase|nr:MAG: [FeFe] hydrogenase H-cluster radical SAM maturase HydG [Deltaproteobacteria bacterium HGW-Deltaproteobacteria-14]